jgi:Tfp pilus assembly protein PilN
MQAMEQQVNLYQPMFLAERRLFSARAIGASLGVVALALVALWGYGQLRMTRLDREIALLREQDAHRTQRAARQASALHSESSPAELEARIHALDLDLAARREALTVLRRSSPGAAEGYAARLQALAHARVRGVWLQKIVLSSGEAQLALQGASIDPGAIPGYVQALKAERVLTGAQFDEIQVERDAPHAPPAQVTFRLADARLKLAELQR